MTQLSAHIQQASQWLTARWGGLGNVVLLLALLLVPVFCLPLALLYGWAYLRWRLAPAVLLLRGQPLGQSWSRLALALAGSAGAAMLAVLLPARLHTVGLAAAALAALGVWREVWGEPAPEPARDHVEWFWLGGAAAIVLLFWLDDTPHSVKARLVFFVYASGLSLMLFLRPKAKLL